MVNHHNDHCLDTCPRDPSSLEACSRTILTIEMHLRHAHILPPSIWTSLLAGSSKVSATFVNIPPVFPTAILCRNPFSHHHGCLHKPSQGGVVDGEMLLMLEGGVER